MRRRRKALLMIVSFLLIDLAAIGQSSRDDPAGVIVLGGGYFEQEQAAALLKRIIDLAGGAGISLVIIPTANSQLQASPSLVEYETAVRGSFARLGVTHVTILHTRDRRVADSEAFAAPLQNANC